MESILSLSLSLSLSPSLPLWVEPGLMVFRFFPSLIRKFSQVHSHLTKFPFFTSGFSNFFNARISTVSTLIQAEPGHLRHLYVRLYPVDQMCGTYKELIPSLTTDREEGKQCVSG
uniref:Uncharacterized protein n=1 Tax=Cacopsylla melanoneura TaxID=428564 RepID=A0A8D8Q8P0_9HEMI